MNYIFLEEYLKKLLKSADLYTCKFNTHTSFSEKLGKSFSSWVNCGKTVDLISNVTENR
jgi:hypothetical protein